MLQEQRSSLILAIFAVKTRCLHGERVVSLCRYCVFSLHIFI